jgi:NADH-quinone oxidoreductase subunit D
MRVILMELARIGDHLICNGVTGMDSGAITGLTYMFIERERIYDMYEQICGARMTTNMGRIGGFERDFTPKFHELLKDFLKLSHQDSKNSVPYWKETEFSWTEPSVQELFLQKEH